MSKQLKRLWLLSSALSLIACSKISQPHKPEPPAPCEANSASTNPAPSSVAPVSPPNGRAVKTEMRNVLFHLTDKVAAHLQILSGELLPTGKNQMPVFDDKTSFSVHVTTGKISITTDALAEIMNTHVFARSDAPLKALSISIDKGRLIIKGKLHGKRDISFQTTGSVSVTSDGRIRMHSEKVKAFHVPVEGMMGLVGLGLANIVNTSKIDGIETDKNDLLMDLATLLPPPHIEGKLTGVKIEDNSIVTYFGDGGRSSSASTQKGSYMSFQGNSVQFGKLIMEDTDLTVLDIDSSDTLDWNQDRYKEQLVAGYSKITANFGLRAYVKDFAKLPRSSTHLPTATPKTD